MQESASLDERDATALKQKLRVIRWPIWRVLELFEENYSVGSDVAVRKDFFAISPVLLCLSIYAVIGRR